MVIIIKKNHILGSILISPIFITLKKFHSPLLEKRELLLKCYNEGLYHITKEENIINILESGYIISSNSYQSYGKEKVYLFAGIPTFEDVCFNISLKEKLVAIKINPSYEQLSSFIYRSKNDEAIAYEGNLNLVDKQIEIAYLGLSKENDKFVYKRISKDEYDNYKPNFDNKDLKNNIIRQLKALSIGLEQQYKYTIDYFNNTIKNSQNKKK